MGKSENLTEEGGPGDDQMKLEQSYSLGELFLSEVCTRGVDRRHLKIGMIKGMW